MCFSFQTFSSPKTPLLWPPVQSKQVRAIPPQYVHAFFYLFIKSEMGRRFISRIFLYLREYFYTSHKSSLSRARAHAHIKHHFFVRARPTCARKSQTLLSSIDLSIDDRGWKVGSSFLHRLLFLLEMHKSSVFFLYL